MATSVLEPAETDAASSAPPDVRLAGAATSRKVQLDVTVDGVEGAALAESPVQSMDPARVLDSAGQL